MTPERWQQIEQLYYSATEREPARRTAYLEEACQNDPGLRAEVEKLLAAAGEASSFLATPALERAAGNTPRNSPRNHLS